jgi:hypothetical protein
VSNIAPRKRGSLNREVVRHGMWGDRAEGTKVLTEAPKGPSASERLFRNLTLLVAQTSPANYSVPPLLSPFLISRLYCPKHCRLTACIYFVRYPLTLHGQQPTDRMMDSDITGTSDDTVSSHPPLHSTTSTNGTSQDDQREDTSSVTDSALGSFYVE